MNTTPEQPELSESIAKPDDQTYELATPPPPPHPTHTPPPPPSHAHPTHTHHAPHTHAPHIIANPPSPPLSRPPQRRDRGAWLMLIGCLVLAAMPLGIELHRADATHPDEIDAIAVAVSSRLQHHKIADADPLFGDRLVPFRNMTPLFDQPPGLSWLHRLSFRITTTIGRMTHGPTYDIAPERYVFFARLVSVIAVLIATASVFWASHSLVGPISATVAALVFAGSPAVVYYGRMATAPAVHLGLVSLGIAAGLWAMRPMRTMPRVERVFLGWVLCGASIGATLLTIGPRSAIEIIVPLFVMMWLCPRRPSHIIGLTAATVIGTLAALPWAVYAQHFDPQAWDLVLPRSWHSLMPTLSAAYWTDPWTLVLLIALLMPWPMWLFGVLVQPFSTSSRGVRLRLFLSWSWFVATAVVVLIWRSPAIDMMAPPANSDHASTTQILDNANRYADLLPILPAGGVLLGQIVRQYKDRCDEGRAPRVWRWLRWPHLVFVMVLSVMVPVSLGLQSYMVSGQWITVNLTSNPGWGYWLGMGLVLVAIASLSIRWTLRHYADRAMICWGIWGIVMLSLIVLPASRSTLTRQPVRYDAMLLLDQTHDSPIYWLSQHDPPAALTIYTGQLLPTVHVAGLPDLLIEHEPVFLLADADRRLDSQFATEPIAHLTTLNLNLYRLSAVPAIGAEPVITTTHTHHPMPITPTMPTTPIPSASETQPNTTPQPETQPAPTMIVPDTQPTPPHVPTPHVPTTNPTTLPTAHTPTTTPSPTTAPHTSTTPQP